MREDEAYIFENDFKKRAEITIPLILNELMKPIQKDKKAYYMRHKNRVDAQKYFNEHLTNIRCHLTKYLNDLISNVEFGEFLYFGEKSLKNKIFMLRYMTFLTNLEDRVMLYDAYMANIKIPLKTIKEWYNDIDYKFYTLRLEFTREEQDAYHERHGFKSIDLIDIERKQKGQFTRNELIESELQNNQNLFVDFLPEAIVKLNNNYKKYLLKKQDAPIL
tara:strand:+ start:192 stop:848 length:657 start_codon:yes stop_codon:yes gene_type:complete